MTAAVEQLFNSAMNLPEDQLRELTDALNELAQSEEEFVLTPEWREEIRRRSELIAEGQVTFFTWDEVRESVRKELADPAQAN